MDTFGNYFYELMGSEPRDENGIKVFSAKEVDRNITQLQIYAIMTGVNYPEEGMKILVDFAKEGLYDDIKFEEINFVLEAYAQAMSVDFVCTLFQDKALEENKDYITSDYLFSKDFHDMLGQFYMTALWYGLTSTAKNVRDVPELSQLYEQADYEEMEKLNSLAFIIHIQPDNWENFDQITIPEPLSKYIYGRRNGNIPKPDLQISSQNNPTIADNSSSDNKKQIIDSYIEIFEKNFLSLFNKRNEIENDESVKNIVGSDMTLLDFRILLNSVLLNSMTATIQTLKVINITDNNNLHIAFINLNDSEKSLFVNELLCIWVTSSIAEYLETTNYKKWNEDWSKLISILFDTNYQNLNNQMNTYLSSINMGGEIGKGQVEVIDRRIQFAIGKILGEWPENLMFASAEQIESIEGNPDNFNSQFDFSNSNSLFYKDLLEQIIIWDKNTIAEGFNGNLDEYKFYLNYGICEIYQSLIEYNKVIKYLTRNLDLDISTLRRPDDLAGSLYFRLGAAYTVLGEFSKSLDWFDKSTQFKPDDPISYNAKAVVLIALNQPDRAFIEVDKAIKLDPEESINYATKSMTYRKIGDLNSALRQADIARKLDPDNEEIKELQRNIINEIKTPNRVPAQNNGGCLLPIISVVAPLLLILVL